MTGDTTARPTVVELLEFERSQPSRHTGQKTAAIAARFGIAAGPYYQQLIAAVRTREAIEHDALLARQIRDRMEAGNRLRLSLIRRRTH